MGFCFFNNVAVAARHATVAHGLERVLILDWDVHHGNGTNDIFHADDDVLFVSIHQWPLYPGTGPPQRRRLGRRRGATRSTCRCPAGRATTRTARSSSTSPARWSRAWEPAARARLRGLRRPPRRSAGRLQVTEAGFAGMTASLRRACDEVGRARRGGCSRAATRWRRWRPRSSRCCRCSAATRGRRSTRRPCEVHPLAADAARRLEPIWPSLAGRGVALSALSPARPRGARRPRRRSPRPRTAPATALSYWPTNATQ